MSIPSLSASVPSDFRSTEALVRQALAAEGFGVLTEIDVRSTLRQKLGTEIEDYLILGVCNPSLAYQALEIDRSVGMLLPCTVVVRAGAAVGVTTVEAQDPTVMVALTGLAELQPVADDAGARLRRALASLPSASVAMTR
mgnify:FL=1